MQSIKPVLLMRASNGSERKDMGGSIITSMEFLKPTMPFVGQAEGEGRFRTLLSVYSNFANLNHRTEVMQLRRLRG